MERPDISAIHARAREALLKLPGVVGVGFGIKETGGALGDQAAIRVYVREKKPDSELAPEERIPASFEGIPTDVLTVAKGRAFPCQDTTQYSPLIGGTSITNFKKDASDKQAVGTLGFFATVNGVSGPKNVVMVSNHHVLMANGAAVEDHVYHPAFKLEGGTTTLEPDTGYVAVIDNAGKMDHHNFTYPEDSPPDPKDYYVDCATARLNISVSSWCNTNCGVSYKNEVRILEVQAPGDSGPVSKIKGIARVTDAETKPPPSSYVAYKVGRETSRTKGVVKEIYGSIDLHGTGIVHGVMLVTPTDPDCDGIMRFATEGDSGSAVVNAERELIGILFGGADDNSEGWVSHIHPVLDVLKVNPITEANPPVAPAGKALADMEGFLADGINETGRLRERMLATPLGAEMYETALAHSAEVTGLVNHRRPVTLAWHRSKGPAFLAHAIENARNPAHLIPSEVEGFDAVTLLQNMADVLIEHGRPPLAEAIGRWLPLILRHARNVKSLHDLAPGLEKEAARG